MTSRVIILSVTLLTAWSLPGCFSDEPLTAIADAAVSETVTEEASSSDTPDAAVPPASLPNACDETTPCTKGACRSGVCVPDPPEGTSGGVTDTDNVPTGASPNLLCVDQAPVAPSGPETVTLYGAVARFGNGQKTIDIQVDLFDARTFDPSVCEDAPTATKRNE